MRSSHSPTLYDILHNDLILHHISPYIGVTALFSIGATSTIFRNLIRNSPQVLTHLDLSDVKSISKPQWYQDSGDSLSEEDYYAQPLDRVISALRPHFLQYTRVLLLDGLYVSSKILTDLLCNDAYGIRILSLRGVQGVSDSSVRRILRYALRSGRREHSKLRALYYFQVRESGNAVEQAFKSHTVIGEHEGITMTPGATLGAGFQDVSSSEAGDDPYSRSTYASFGVCKEASRDIKWEDWTTLLQACSGRVAFDMVLCPQHHSKIATVRLKGCQSCGSCPEKPAYPGFTVSSISFSLTGCGH